MSEYDPDIADFEDLLDDAKQWKIAANMWKASAHTWKEMAEIRMDGCNYWISRWEDEKDMADWQRANAEMWRLRANKAKNLAQDLADILSALRGRGKLSLQWNDTSAAKWHGLPKSWRDYISKREEK